MTIFLSWSGERSRIAAAAMDEWLRKIFPDVNPWLSSDTEAGRRWNDAVIKKLAEAAFGILFVDGSNLVSPWLLFEAGAMATRFSHSQVKVIPVDRYVCPYLLDLTLDDLRQSPLNYLQAKIANERGTFELVDTINKLRERGSFDGETLGRLFRKNWSHLQSKITTPVRELWLVGASLVHTSDHYYRQLKKRVLQEGYTIKVLLPDVRDDTVIVAASRRSSKGKSTYDKRVEICATLRRLCLLQQEAADYKPTRGSPPPGKLKIRTTRHVLGYGVDGTDPNGSLDLKLYPTALHPGDKPHFVLRRGDPHHGLLEQELSALWKDGKVWNCRTNCLELIQAPDNRRASDSSSKPRVVKAKDWLPGKIRTSTHPS